MSTSEFESYEFTGSARMLCTANGDSEALLKYLKGIISGIIPVRKFC